MAKLPQGFVVESSPSIPEGFEVEETRSGELETPVDVTQFVSGGMVEGIPIAGPFLRRGAEMAAAATLAPFSDLTYSEILAEIDAQTEAEQTANPGLDVASQVGGALLSTAGAATTTTGARALGLGPGNLGQRALRQGVSGGAIGGLDQAARGIVGDGLDLEETGQSTLLGAGLGVALPVAGAGIREGARSVGDRLKDALQRIRNPRAAAEEAVVTAANIDRAEDAAMLGAEEVAAAFRNQQPLVAADLGGENVRALLRAAANQSPSARSSFNRITTDRFADQAGRVVDQVRRSAGGAVDDLEAQEAILGAARAVNRPAYRRAFNDPQAQEIFTPRIQELLQSRAVQTAIRGVEGRASDRAAVEGRRAVSNPFVQNESGQLVLRTNPETGEAVAAPSLEFWNQVKINLDSMWNKARRAGDRSRALEFRNLADELIDELDAQVPTYRQARQGAAMFFGAEDAIEAGKKFGRTSRVIPEMRRAVNKLKGAEKDAFKIGFASEIIDRAQSTNDRVNVVRQFQSPEMRKKIELAFGKGGARDFEAFVRVENAMDLMRGALGNSTTARQLIESGVIGGGTWLTTGDFNTGVMAAAATAATGKVRNKINERVMKEVADILVSNDPEAIERLVKSAARSPETMAAVDAWTQIVAGGARAAGNEQIEGQ